MSKIKNTMLHCKPTASNSGQKHTFIDNRSTTLYNSSIVFSVTILHSSIVEQMDMLNHWFRAESISLITCCLQQKPGINSVKQILQNQIYAWLLTEHTKQLSINYAILETSLLCINTLEFGSASWVHKARKQYATANRWHSKVPRLHMSSEMPFCSENIFQLIINSTLKMIRIHNLKLYQLGRNEERKTMN